jgi:hypothetical protein
MHRRSRAERSRSDKTEGGLDLYRHVDYVNIHFDNIMLDQ